MWNTGDAATAQAGVSYRVIGSVSLASGNPVGDPEHWGSAIEQWRAKARASGWSLAVMGAGEQGAAAYAEAGLTAFEIGDEAILDMRTFSLNGPGMKAVRQSVSRLQRRGYTTTVARHGDAGPCPLRRAVRRPPPGGEATAATNAASPWRSVG